MTNFIIPLIIVLIFLYALFKKVDIFKSFINGAKEGIKTSISILPTLIGLMAIVGMVSCSGAIDFLSYLLSPLTSFLHIPPEAVPIGLLRPFSGSGSLTLLDNLLNNVSPDSYLGTVCSVLVCCSETTFYTLTVYFGAVNISKTRYALPCALIGDFSALLLSVYTVNLFCF